MRRSGFTLIELSIVLVIIGLLVGGVLVGADLIKAAELRKVHKEQEAISTAVQTFKSKYNCMPGDCDHAGDFWTLRGDCPDLSAASLGSPATYTDLTPSEDTCDGDGDKRIDANITAYETSTFWQHLGNAKLVPGTYAAGFDIGGGGSLAGINTMASGAINNTFWATLDGDNWQLLETLMPGESSLPLMPGRYGAILVFSSTAVGSFPLSPMDAYTLDSKYDDGKPATGRLVVLRSVGADPPNCTDLGADEVVFQASNVSGQYFISSATYKNQKTCQVAYVTGW